MLAAGMSVEIDEGRPFRPLDGGVELSSFTGILEIPGFTEGSSNCPAGVSSRPPSGLKFNRLKKLVKLSSPYNLTEDQDDGFGRLRIAGSGGIGEGERPYRPKLEGELGALDPLKEERLDDGLSIGGGGNMDSEGVLATEVAGVSGAVSLPYEPTLSSLSFG